MNFLKSWNHIKQGVSGCWWVSLSIDIIEAEVGRPTIFKAENILTSDYLPEHLLFRESHMKTLTGYFKGLILQPTKFTQNVVVMGGIGIGKTALVKRFGMNFEQVAQKYGVSMKYIHVNCRKKQTNFLVLLHIIHELDPHYPSRGYSSEELMETLLGILEDRGLSLLLCLDEVDFLVTKNGSDLIYSLVRISDDKIDRRGKISLALIVRDSTFRRHLDPSTISSIPFNTIYLEKYSVPQLQEILELRASEAYHRGTVSTDSLNFIAEIAGPWSDARYAIELLWRAGKQAEMRNSMIILPDHVRHACASIHPAVQRELLEDLPSHNLFLLLGISRELSRNNTPYSSIKEIEESYLLVCEEYNTTPRGHTQVWQYIRNLCNWGILTAKVVSQGIKGRTTFISLPDVPAKSLESEIEHLLKTKFLGGQ